VTAPLPSSPSSGIDDLIAIIEPALQAACPRGGGTPDRLADAMAYALLAPGKRLRPALVLLAAEVCGGGIDVALPGAVAVEMIHAYSLIHDDLPAMDDDDLRRGRPTVHVEFDEATAILAGDALLAEAFAHLAARVRHPAIAREAILTLASAAGSSALVGGQGDDLAAESLDPGFAEDPGGPPTTLEVAPQAFLESIHRRKTGALITAALDLGAILSTDDASDTRLLPRDDARRVGLRAYGDDLGLAFQVVDDLLDFTSSDETLGKRTGKDSDRGKWTYPGILGLKPARDYARSLTESAKSRLDVFQPPPQRLIRLADYVLERPH